MKRVIVTTVFAIGLVLLGAGSLAAQEPQAPQAPKAVSVAGDWDASLDTPGGAVPLKLIFKVDGEKLTGTAKRSSGDVPLTGTIKGSDISFSYTINYNGNDLTLTFTGKVNGDSMGGNVSFGGNADGDWSAKRTPPPAKPKAD